MAVLWLVREGIITRTKAGWWAVYVPPFAMRLRRMGHPAPGLFWLVERVEGARFLSFAAAGGPLGFDFYWVRFAGGVVVEAAPAVVFGFRDQAAGARVAGDVLE